MAGKKLAAESSLFLKFPFQEKQKILIGRLPVRTLINKFIPATAELLLLFISVLAGNCCNCIQSPNLFSLSVFHTRSLIMRKI